MYTYTYTYIHMLDQVGRGYEKVLRYKKKIKERKK